MYLTQLIKSFNPKTLTKSIKLDSGAALDMSEAALLIQRSERGRQGREALQVKLINKKQRQLADRRNRTGLVITHEMAVIKIQSALRGMLWRRRIQKEADQVRSLRPLGRRTETHQSIVGLLEGALLYNVQCTWLQKTPALVSGPEHSLRCWSAVVHRYFKTFLWARQ